MSLPAIDEPASVRLNDRERTREDVDTLPRRQLAQEQDDRSVSEVVRRAERRAVGSRLELTVIDRVRHDDDSTRRDAEPQQLRALGVADRQHARRAGQQMSSSGASRRSRLASIRRSNGWRGAVRRDHVGNAGARQRPCGARSREVVTGVEMPDVERPGAFAEPRAQPRRREELPVIRQPVREVGEDLRRRASHRSGRCGELRSSATFVAGIGREYGHMVAASRQRPASGSSRAAGCPRTPRRAVVRHDVQNAKREVIGELVPYSIRVRSPMSFATTMRAAPRRRPVRRARLDAHPHRFRNPLPRHDRRFRVGASEAADDVPRAADGLLLRLCQRAPIQARSHHRAVPVRVLPGGDQDRAAVAPGKRATC